MYVQIVNDILMDKKTEFMDMESVELVTDDGLVPYNLLLSRLFSILFFH